MPLIEYSFLSVVWVDALCRLHSYFTATSLSSVIQIEFVKNKSDINDLSDRDRLDLLSWIVCLKKLEGLGL